MAINCVEWQLSISEITNTILGNHFVTTVLVLAQNNDDGKFISHTHARTHARMHAHAR